MKGRTIFITGTDTGAGKTILAALLTRFLRQRGVNPAALKPVCSGGRGDARVLRAAMDGTLTLDEVNPWHFRAPLAPLLAARQERRRLTRGEVLRYVRDLQARFDVVLVEGAGGLLSPLGEDFNSRDLIIALRATPMVVCPNRLGAVNQVLLTLAALPRREAARARVVLTAPPRPDLSSRGNVRLLAEILGRKRIFKLPRVNGISGVTRALNDRRVRRMLLWLAFG